MCVELLHRQILINVNRIVRRFYDGHCDANRKHCSKYAPVHEELTHSAFMFQILAISTRENGRSGNGFYWVINNKNVAQSPLNFFSSVSSCQAKWTLRTFSHSSKIFPTRMFQAKLSNGIGQSLEVLSLSIDSIRCLF